MLEGPVANLINKYLGKYIQNLDSSNLNLSIFQGDVKLTDLQLRREALFELDLPIEVKAGHVGKINLEIPWTSIFSSSVVVTLEDVYILAGPISDRQYDSEKERKLQNAIKRQKLEALETSTIDKVADQADEDPGFFEKLASYVINNIQLTVRNIHIRYEDTVTNTDDPFACGLMLKEVSAHTTDSKWHSAQVDTKAIMIHKLLLLQDLAVYWNPYIPDQQLVRRRLNTDRWKNLLKTSIDSHTIFGEDFEFIVEPISSRARVIINKDSSLLTPKLFADVTPEDIEIMMSRRQFSSLLSLSDSFQMMSINQRYRKYNPNVPLTVSPKSWWYYAYNAVVEEMIRPFSWERIKEHRVQYRKYKDLYMKSLELPEHESIKSKLWELEEGLNVTNILIAREHAKLEFAHEAPDRAKRKEKNKPKSWFSWFWDSGEEAEVEVELADKDSDWLSELSKEEKERLYKGVGYDINASAVQTPPEYVAYKIQLIMKSCCLSLVNYSKTILQVSVNQVLASWEYRPGSEAFRVSCNTESFAIEGASVEHELVPILTSDIGVYAPSVNQVFTFDLEMKPIYLDADFSLKLNIQPVEIVYDVHSISEVTAFFQLPDSSIDMKAAAMETLQGMAQYSRAGLQYAIEQHKTVHVSVNMRSPYIVIPEHGTLHSGGNVLVIDFGNLTVESELQPKDVSLEDSTMSEIESRLYDQFNIRVTDVKMLFADSGDDWHTAQTQPDSDYHILPSMEVALTFFNAVKPDYKQLPRHKVVTSLPTLKLNISDKRLITLFSFFNNFPMPTSTSMVTIAEDNVAGGIAMPPAVLDLNDTQLEPTVLLLRKIRNSVLRRQIVRRIATAFAEIDGPEPAIIEPSVVPSGDMYFSASDNSEDDEAWSSYLEVKPVEDSSSAANSIRILLRVMFGELVVHLSRAMDRYEKPYLMFRADRLCVDAAITVHGLACHIRLGGIELVDKIHVGVSGEYMELLSTKSDTDLVSIKYRQVNPKCVDFEKIYKRVEQGMVMKINTLSILCDQTALKYLNTFIQDMRTKIQINGMRMSTSTVILTPEVMEKDRPSFRERMMSIVEEGDQKTGKIMVSVSGQMENLNIHLCNAENRIAHIDIRGLEGQLVAKPGKMTFKCELKDFSVRDCSAGALYPNILMIEDKNDSLFDMKLVKYQKSEKADNKRSEQSLDYSIRLRIGHLQVVFLSKFYWDVIRCFEPFKNPEITEAATYAVESVTKQVEGIQPDNTRINVNIDMRSPTLIIPQNSRSTDFFMVELGDLSVKNFFNQTDVTADTRQEWNHIYINLNSVQINRAYMSMTDDTFHVKHSILEPITFKADICMAMEPQVSEIKYDMTGRLDLVKGSLVQKDIQIMFGILRENLTEGAPQAVNDVYDPTVINFYPHLSVESATPVVEDREIITATNSLPTSILITLEGASFTLYDETVMSEIHRNSALARFDMGKIDIASNSDNDGDMKVNIVLQSISIVDVRHDSDLAVKRILHCAKRNGSNVEELQGSHSPLVSVIYKISGDGSQKADVMMEKMRLNVHLPYIIKLWDFYSRAFQTSNVELVPTPSHVLEEAETEFIPLRSSMTVYGTVKQPEIVLFADPSKFDSRVLVLNADFAFEYTTDSEKENIWSKVSNLQMFSCIYGSRKSSTSRVIHPCDVEFKRSFKPGEEQMEMSASMDKINIHISPRIMHLLLDVSQMYPHANEQSPDISRPPKLDNNNLWAVTDISSHKWLDKTDEVYVRPSLLSMAKPPKETFTVEIREISAFFEVENMDHHVPLLCLQTSMEGKICDWTKQLNVSVEMNLDLHFFNEKLCVWEPLIEPVMEQEGVYRSWQVFFKLIQAKGYPIACNYDDNGLEFQDGMQSEVQHMMHRNRAKSNGSETETDSSSDMTVLRPKFPRKARLGSDRSYGSVGYDEHDAANLREVEEEGEEVETAVCNYVVIASQDRLLLNVTPQSISVLTDIVKDITEPASSQLIDVSDLPAFEINNMLGVHGFFTLHSDVKIHKEHVKDCTLYRAGEEKENIKPIIIEDDINSAEKADRGEKEGDLDELDFLGKVLCSVGHTVVNAAAFVFDDDDDYLSGDKLDIDRFRLQIDGFEVLPTILHKRACRKLVPLSPKKNATKYCCVLDISMHHGRKLVSIHSPLQVKNCLTVDVDVICKTEELKKYSTGIPNFGSDEYTRITTLSPSQVYHIPLFVAYHCGLYICPTDLGYHKSETAIRWSDLLQNKDRFKHLVCAAEDVEKKVFNVKVVCKEGEPLNPPRTVPKTIPYYIIQLYPPVMLHNFLPYDVQFSLEGTTSSSSLTHGESTPLYTVELQKSYKININVQDYLSCDWSGTLEISQTMDAFKAITMETDMDAENAEKYLSLSIHASQKHSLKLYIYSPYWIVNKTDLQFQLRGSMSDAVLEAAPSDLPFLFRYKKHKKKKAKLRVYEAKWSHSFSLDTVGSCGVIVCTDKERNRKFMFMLHSSMSSLKLTKIVTITPFFLIVNHSTHKLRYMEENEKADLWFDLKVGEFVPFWPETDTFNMYVKYESSNVVSQHFSFKKPNNTILRMDRGSALCVEVAGGTESPITVTFTNYNHGDAPVRVENLCEDVFIKIHQKNQSQVTILQPNNAVLYTWDDPTAERTLMWNVYGRKKPSYPCFINKDGYGEMRLLVQSLRKSGSVDMTDDGDRESSPEDDSDDVDSVLIGISNSFVGRTRTDKMVIYWLSYLDGQQRVLLFTQDERIAKAARQGLMALMLLMNEAELTDLVGFISLDGISVSVMNAAYQEVALVSVTGVPAVWEVEVQTRWKFLNVELATWLEDKWLNEQSHANLQDQIEADLNKMQMVKPYMGALRRTYHPGLWLQYRQSLHHQALHFQVQRVQLDNQLSDAYFPCVFYPCPTPSYIVKRKGLKPFVEVGIMRRTVPDNNVDTFRYFKVLVQEFHIKLDKGFLLSISDVFAHLFPPESSESKQLQSDLKLAQRSLQDFTYVMTTQRPKRIFYEHLHLSPLKMHISFSLNGTPYLTRENLPSIGSDIVDFFLGSIGATLTEIKEVELRMAFYQLKGSVLSTNQLLAQIRSHYTQQAIQQAYVLIFGLDVLGNPYGLIKDFTQGLGDLFYEPVLGTIQGSDDFADSLRRGMKSLLGHTVGGAASSVARVTGSLGNILAILTFDDSYRKRRHIAMQQHPHNLPVMLVIAAKGMALGVCLGLSGVVLDPVKGASEEGVEGFFRGIGKGIMGLITKPTGGVLDMVSIAFDGIRRVAEMEHGIVARMRLPRFVNPYLGLRPYSGYQAAGKRLLLTLKKGQYASSDIYWSHAPLNKDDRADVVLITDKHVFLLERCRIWGGWDVEWVISIEQILGVPALIEDQQKLVFKIRQDENSLNLFSGTEQEVTSPDITILKWIQRKIEYVTKFRQQ